MTTVTCGLCPHGCALGEGQIGRCKARSNRDGRIVSDNYGVVTALSLDPIEKKPLNRFHPGGMVLSVGSFGCNLSCPFCQNHHISMNRPETIDPTRAMKPEELVEKALELRSRGNIGLAFTYNEPLVGYEFVYDCAALASRAGLLNVLVTNGYINRAPLRELLPYIHAMNIDLKSAGKEFYASLGGDPDTVKETILEASAVCHVEITTLIVPGENDTEEEILEIARWLASVDKDIPYHISRFFPRWRMSDMAPTPVSKIYTLAAAARRYSRYVYEGNC